MQKVFNWEAVRIALLVLVAGFLACALTARWTARDWQTPIEYGVDGPTSDAKFYFAAIKAASEGHYPLILSKQLPEFGAPFVANWDDYPSIEELHVVVPGYLARFIGLFAAANVMTLAAHLCAALGFYLACRLLGYRWEWSFAGALIYGFSAYIFGRSLHHISVGYVGHLPLMVVVFRWAITRGGLEKRHFQWALLIAAITAVQHVYYTNLLMQFLGIAALYQACQKDWRSVSRIVAVGATGVFCFLVMNLDTFLASHAHGANPTEGARVYQYLEYYGFKLADLFIPQPNYWIPSLAEWGDRYFSQALLKGEVPYGSYLGIAGIAAFAWLVAASLRNVAQASFKRPPWEAFLVAWVVLYATVGGLNGWIGSLGFVLFRSTTRYTAAILALVLMYAVRRLSGLTAKWGTEQRVAVAVMVAAVAIWDQVPRTFNENQAAVAEAVRSDRSFAEELESSVKPGAMVFQLPVMNFPESPAPGVPPYDHFRPFYYTKALRYSFGDVKGRPNTAWQSEMALLTPEVLMQKLESYGFGALYINRRGFADHGKSYLDAAQARGSRVLNNTAGDLACVLLNPSASPLLPPQAPYFGKGWYEAENDGAGHQQRLCHGRGEVVLTNPGAEPVERYLQFHIQGTSLGNISLSMDGASLGTAAVQANAAVRVQNLKVTLKPGPNVLAFSSDRPPVWTMRGPINFSLVNFHLTQTPAP